MTLTLQEIIDILKLILAITAIVTLFVSALVMIIVGIFLRHSDFDECEYIYEKTEVKKEL